MGDIKELGGLGREELVTINFDIVIIGFPFPATDGLRFRWLEVVLVDDGAGVFNRVSICDPSCSGWRFC